MKLDPRTTELLVLFGKAYLNEIEKGENERATLFAKAFLACERVGRIKLESREDGLQTILNNILQEFESVSLNEP
jgi:hypothetical protein